VSDPATTVQRRRSANRRQETRWALFFLAPWIIGFAFFTAGPMLASLWLSFTDYNLISSPSYVGTENYQRLVEDPKVAAALGNTLFYTVLHVPLQIVLALALAMLLHRVSRTGAGRTAGFFRTVLYLPVMTPPVALAALFLLLLNGSTGAVNDLLGWFGVDGPNWTTDPTWIKPGIVVMQLWTVGSTVVIYLAALSSVPEDLYEAARLDGAGAWRQFRSVTLPMISGTVYFTVLVNTIGSLQIFTEAYAMYFGAGAQKSSEGDAALFYVIYLFQKAFETQEMGYASALAWLLFLVIVAITAVQVRASRRLVYYEGER
jgi:multiple sugar transport system permease protein